MSIVINNMNIEKINIPQRSGWAIFFYLMYIPIATVFGFVCAVGIYAFIRHGLRTWVETFILLGLVAGIFVSFWLIIFTIRFVRRRKLPLAIIEDIGIHFPLQNPNFLAWSEVRTVEQIMLGRWTTLRFVLHKPALHLGGFRRRWQWPYHDSLLLPIELDGPTVPSPVLTSVQAAHRRHQENSKLPQRA